MEHLVIPDATTEITEIAKIGTLSLFCAVGVVGLTSNVMLIVSVLRKPELRTSPTYVTLASLAASDVFVLLFLPSFLYIMYTGNGDEVMCEVFMYGLLAAQGCSMYHIVLFAALRYVILIKPLFAMKHLTVMTTIGMCVLVWSMALLGASSFSAVGTMTFNSSHGNFSASFCIMRFDSQGSLLLPLLLLGVIPIILMASFHIAKAYQIRHRTIRSENVMKRRQVSTKLILGILVTFAVSALPSGIGWSVVLNDPESGSFEDVLGLYILTALLFVNSSVDPLFYFCFSGKRDKPVCCVC